MAPGKDVRIEDCSVEIRAGVPPAALSRRGERVEDVERLLAPGSQAGADYASPAAVAVRAKTLQEARREFERKMVLEALDRNDWNVSRAADELGLERTNLHKKIKQFGLGRKQ
jgi:DNA-binding NtrC family response regulator